MLSVSDAAEACGATESDIRTWAKKGRIKIFKGPNGNELVRLLEVKKYMLQHGLSNSFGAENGVGGEGLDEDGRGAILIVDDDAMVRGMVVQILRPLYPLYEARDGYEAVRQIQSRDDIRVVLLDIRMPGQSGIETYEQITQIRPDVVVVIVSGYIEDVPDSMMADNAVCGIVEKPVSEELLLDTVALAMDGVDSL